MSEMPRTSRAPNAAQLPRARRSKPEETDIDLMELLYRLLEKAKHIIAAALLGALIAGGIVTFAITPHYTATSKLYVISGGEEAIDFSDLQVATYLASDYQEVFQNWRVHEMVLQKLGLPYTYEELDDMLEVSNPVNSRLLYISVTVEDAPEAKALADAYASAAQAFIADVMDTRTPALFAEALLPSEPSWPNRLFAVVLGLLIGGLLCCIVITCQFLMDDRIRNAEEIATHLALPSLGVMPRLHDAIPVHRTPSKRGSVKSAAFEKTASLDHAGREALNTICSNLSFAGRRFKKIVVTSCDSRDGKSYLTLQIARELALRGRRVVVVDANLRRSDMADQCPLQADGERNGLAHYLAGDCAAEDILCPTVLNGLYLVPAGRPVVNPLPLFYTAEFSSWLDELAQTFDTVLVDTPPVGAVIDAADIAQHCDGCVLVLEYGKTRRRSAAMASCQIARAGCPIIGCILNKAVFDAISARNRFGRGCYGHDAPKAGTRHKKFIGRRQA